MHADSPSSNSRSSPPQHHEQQVAELSSTSETTTSTLTSTSESGAVVNKISFSVTRRETSRVVVTAKNKLDGPKGRTEEEEDEEAEEEQHRAKKRAVLSLEDGVAIHAEPRAKREKKLFVIPVLQLSTQSQIVRIKQLVEEGSASDADRARLALLLESVDENQRQEKIAVSSASAAGLQTGPTVVVADDADPDYESMPVGEFGLAFLRGCGWKDEKSCIGKSNPQAVPLRVTAPRPKGLGLGAVLPSTAEPPTSKKGAKEEMQEKDKQLGKHSYVKCLGGLNKGAFGQVTSMDEENASAFVELAWPPGGAGRTVRVSQMALELVPSKEFAERLRAASREEKGPTENGERRRRKELRV